MHRYRIFSLRKLMSPSFTPVRVLALALALPACTSGSGPAGEPLAVAQNAVFVNGSFEIGAPAAAPPSWIVQTFLNPGITVESPQTRAGLNLANGGDALTTILSATNQADPDLGAGASLRFCRYGAQCAIVNDHSSMRFGHSRNVNSLSQSMTIAAGDIDATDGLAHVRFTIAPVLENPVHAPDEQPYYLVQVTNTTTSTLLYSDFNLSAQAGVPWKTINGGMANEIDYIDWSLVDVAPGPALLALGDTVRLELIAAGCSQGGHFGELYVDGVGTAIPGLFIRGVGPAQANPGGLVTYTLTYKNGSAAPETGIAINFTTPPNTTFQSITPPPGVTCVTPPAGTAGTITCTQAGALAAGASATFPILVSLSGAATGQLVCGDYAIRSTQETPLNGNKIVTTIGCATDAVCGVGTWCSISNNQCTPTLANGFGIPTDAPHVNPTLNAMCTVSAGALVCQSAVCDAIDNQCGKRNGSGICTLLNQATVCRSGVCDLDSACGFATNHGPCSAANQATVCRSGSCSTNLLCQPALGCNTDADCTGGNWCNEALHACTPKLANGTILPTDVPHTNPTLNGTCSSGVGTLVCQAAVCDPDNKCGFAVNSGPCTTGTAATVCRSASCSNNGLCQPTLGCNVDVDCALGQWCAEATHLCTAKLGNGASIPTDLPHANPTLDGSCTLGAGSLVCQAAVCDSNDNKCGKLNGSAGCTVVDQAIICRSGVCDTDGSCGFATDHGPCSPINQATVCRSGVCSANGLCQPAGGCNLDIDCTAGQWCNETIHSCSVKLSNGSLIPTDAPHTAPVLNATCTTAAATLVCQSAVCDVTDNRCGFDVNDGPCTAANAATVCRSGACSANLLCQPPAGCNVDADCVGGNWCQESLHVCRAPLGNGSVMPTDAPHVSPNLDGTCTLTAGLLVCQSGVCDTADNQCGYDNGHGPCTAGNGALLCRSGACGNDLKCRPAAGCNVDADCTAGNWCEESTGTCRSPLANGAPLPSDAPHTNPTLDGTCSELAASLVCQSAVCDAADNECGFATGHGPCTTQSAGTVCRSGACSTNGLCQTPGGCLVDADCASGKWCNRTLNACLPTLQNGTAIPTDVPHTSPALRGTCTTAAGALVCTSGVCDIGDNECGLPNGAGPCTTANGVVVCRSTRCAPTGTLKGTCVECLVDAECSGTTPICNPVSRTCVACVNSAQCSGETPICDTDRSTCVRCDGDNGAMAAHPCGTTDAPFCFSSGTTAGACGKCATDADCEGHVGNICDPGVGLCVQGCRLDSECQSTEWCNDNSAMCVAKLDNGTPLPKEPARVATCTAEVGSAVCNAGVCDPADDSCGLAPGDGPCDNSEQCRKNSCDSLTKQCTNDCASNADCQASEYCAADGACLPLLPTGTACTTSNQCQTHDCFRNRCSSLVGSGSGFACAVSSLGGDQTNDWGAGLFGLLLGAVGLARRKRSIART